MGRRLCQTLHGLALVCALARPAAAQEENPDELYRQGVELAKAGKLDEARTRFEAAFELSPHPRVLYTLAKVSLEMNDKEAAKHYLRRYLEMDLSVVPPDEPAQVRAALEALEADGEGARSKAKPQPEVEPDVEPEPKPEPEPETEPEPQPEPEAQPAPMPQPAPPVIRRSNVTPPSAPPGPPHTIPLVFTSAGGATILSGLALWLWNDAYYSGLSQDRDSLAQDAPKNPTRSEEVAGALDYARDVGENDGGFEAAKRIDVVAWSLVGVGAACVATGVIWYLLSDDPPAADQARPVDVAVVPRGVELRW